MERTIPRRMSPVRGRARPIAVVAADLHLRETCPGFREPEEFFPAQTKKLLHVRDLCNELGCPLLVAGDLFDHWKPSPFLLTFAFENLPEKVIVIPGQHDLLGHSLENIARTGLQTLASANRVLIRVRGSTTFLGAFTAQETSVYGYGYGEKAQNLKSRVKNALSVLLIHELCCDREQPWPGAGAATSTSVQRRFSNYDFVVSGDNHQTFITPGRVGKIPTHINPGSMMRTTIDQLDHVPSVFILFDDGTHCREALPHDKLTVSEDRKRVSLKSMNEEDVLAYVRKTRKHFERGLSFEENLRKYFHKEQVDKVVRKIILEALHEHGA